MGTRGHAAGVGAVVGLSQAEAADVLARCQLGQVFLLLRLGPNSLIGTITSDDCTLAMER